MTHHHTADKHTTDFTVHHFTLHQSPDKNTTLQATPHHSTATIPLHTKTHCKPYPGQSPRTTQSSMPTPNPHAAHHSTDNIPTKNTPLQTSRHTTSLHFTTTNPAHQDKHSRAGLPLPGLRTIQRSRHQHTQLQPHQNTICRQDTKPHHTATNTAGSPGPAPACTREQRQRLSRGRGCLCSGDASSSAHDKNTIYRQDITPQRCSTQHPTPPAGSPG